MQVSAQFSSQQFDFSCSDLSPHEGRGSADIYRRSDPIITVHTKAVHTIRVFRNIDLNFECKRTRPIAEVKLQVSFKTGSITEGKKVE